MSPSDRNENKTKPTEMSVDHFLENVTPATRATDALVLRRRFDAITGMKPVLWGQLPSPSIVGYGRYRYAYRSGRKGEFFITGFAPRKANLVVYVMPGFERYQDQLARLGPHRHSVSCLYLPVLKKLDLDALDEIVADGFERMKRAYEWEPS